MRHEAYCYCTQHNNRRKIPVIRLGLFLLFVLFESQQIHKHLRVVHVLFDNNYYGAANSLVLVVSKALVEQRSESINRSPALVGNKNNASFGAYFANGSFGYVADPKALSQHYHEYMKQTNASFEELLVNYAPRSINNNNTSSSFLDNVCSQRAGVLDEAPEGVELLIRQIQIAPTITTINTTLRPRILCAIYTHPPMRSLARMAALTWGVYCDGFLAFSTETIPELGMVHLHHVGEESYSNMWQKTRSIWSYLRQHYSDDYEYFHLGGDDMYVIVENMRQFLAELNHTSDDQPLHLGQWVRQRRYPYVAGGPGYTLNRQALVKLVDKALPHCHVDTVAPQEDKLVSLCLQQDGIFPYDTRDRNTGQQRYHAAQPSTVYKSRPKSGKGASFQARAQAYFETLPHPTNLNTTVGPQYGLEAAAKNSVAFHNLHNAVYMARVHAILYKTCADESQLAQSLRELAM